MPRSVAATLATINHFDPGDIISINDPYLGGTHLPDITLISPIFILCKKLPILFGFAANRAHYADIGGMSPGSMPLATEIYQEGVIIPPLKIWEQGSLILRFLLFCCVMCELPMSIRRSYCSSCC
jgi:N-methylhydantoinase B